jgi:hypothetical protein
VSSVRGYRLKSSAGPNCSGLTKMVATTWSASARAARSSSAWPSCSAPIVITTATRPVRSARTFASSARVVHTLGELLTR